MRAKNCRFREEYGLLSSEILREVENFIPSALKLRKKMAAACVALRNRAATAMLLPRSGIIARQARITSPGQPS
jgi:hypothetical protein